MSNEVNTTENCHCVGRTNDTVIVNEVNTTENCHCVGRTNDTVIVKFSRRKKCQHIWSVKKDLKKLTMEDLELPGNSKLFINEACAHITRCYGLKARNFIASAKYIVFLFLVTRSRSGSMKIVRRCR